MSIRKDGKLREDPTQPEKVKTTPKGKKLASEKAVEQDASGRPRNMTPGS